MVASHVETEHEVESAKVEKNDLRVEMKIRNNVLWHAIYDNYGSISGLCKKRRKLRYYDRIIGRLLNLNLSPFRQKRARGSEEVVTTTKYRQICLRLARVLKVPVAELFPANLYAAFVDKPTILIREVSTFSALPGATQRELLNLPAPVVDVMDEASHNELREQIRKILRTLSDAEQEILKMRYGLDNGVVHSLAEVGMVFKVTGNRIQQIEAKAIRKLQQPSRSNKLVVFLD